MRRGDDSSLGADERAEVRVQARLALDRAGAIGVFPTPVDEIMRAAKIEIVPLVLDQPYLARLRRKAEDAGRALLGAIAKVWGVFDPHARVAYIDAETPKAKLPFLKLHESGHALLPWQSVFGLFEDCRRTLDPETKAQFEREANVFASDVLFQIDGLDLEAREMPFGIETPIKLARHFGASVYATARRYVAEHKRPCALIVLDPIAGVDGVTHGALLRRVIFSATFARRFPRFAWPALVQAGDSLAKLIPTGAMCRPRSFALTDEDGGRHEFLGETFRTSHHTMILIRPSDAPIRRIAPSAQLLLF